MRLEVHPFYTSIESWSLQISSESKIVQATVVTSVQSLKSLKFLRVSGQAINYINGDDKTVYNRVTWFWQTVGNTRIDLQRFDQAIAQSGMIWIV